MSWCFLFQAVCLILGSELLYWVIKLFLNTFWAAFCFFKHQKIFSSLDLEGRRGAAVSTQSHMFAVLSHWTGYEDGTRKERTGSWASKQAWEALLVQESAWVRWTTAQVGGYLGSCSRHYREYHLNGWHHIAFISGMILKGNPKGLGTGPHSRR